MLRFSQCENITVLLNCLRGFYNLSPWGLHVKLLTEELSVCIIETSGWQLLPPNNMFSYRLGKCFMPPGNDTLDEILKLLTKRVKSWKFYLYFFSSILSIYMKYNRRTMMEEAYLVYLYFRLLCHTNSKKLIIQL